MCSKIRSIQWLLIMAFIFLPRLGANGRMPRMKVEWVPGQAIIKLKEGVVLPTDKELKNSLGRVFSKKAARDSVEVQMLFPAYETQKQGKATATDQRWKAARKLARYALVRAELDTGELVTFLNGHPDVALAEPNYLARLTLMPDDYDAVQQWGLADIQAPAAWDISQGDAAQVIAIIDTGVDLDHPDLARKIWQNPYELEGDANQDNCPGICGTDDDGDGLIDEDGMGRQPGDSGYDLSFIDDDDENGFIDDFYGWDWASGGIGQQDNDPQDDMGHGTHCAGIAAAATDNGIGLARIVASCP